MPVRQIIEIIAICFPQSGAYYDLRGVTNPASIFSPNRPNIDAHLLQTKEFDHLLYSPLRGHVGLLLDCGKFLVLPAVPI